ncbi:MAG: glutathione S-transferase family protein [Acidiferrobacterales bacterium]
MEQLHLYLGNKNYSSWSLRAWLVMKQSGAPFRETVIPLQQDDSRHELCTHSPSCRVPALEHGNTVIWESLAIAEYLAERFPDAHLWPERLQARAVARAVSNEMHAGFAALRTHMPMDVRGRYPAGDRARQPDVLEDIDRIEQLWADCRMRFGEGGDFLFGSFTIADAMYAPVVSRFITYAVELDQSATAYRDTVWHYPAMQEWAAAAQAESWVLEQ